MDFTTLAAQMPTLVPMVGTLNLEFLSLRPDQAILRLPDQPAFHNHISGPHAGAMFTLAESATGALVLGNFGGMLEVATPLAMTSTITFTKVAMGALTAVAVMAADPAEVIAQVRAGGRPEFEIGVTLSVADGTQTGSAVFIWTLRPNRRQPR